MWKGKSGWETILRVRVCVVQVCQARSSSRAFAVGLVLLLPCRGWNNLCDSAAACSNCQCRWRLLLKQRERLDGTHTDRNTHLCFVTPLMCGYVVPHGVFADGVV